MIATAAAKYAKFACTSTCTVWLTSIFQKM